VELGLNVDHHVHLHVDDHDYCDERPHSADGP